MLLSHFHQKTREFQVVPDLEISEPDLGVKEGEREDMVDEWFGSPGLGRHAKYLRTSCNNDEHPTTGQKYGNHHHSHV
jgi:hypothetical protein